MTRFSAFVSTLAAASAVTFNADMSGSVYNMQYPILNCMGSSHGSTTLRGDWRDHLTSVRKDTNVKHVRFHGVLDDDMSTYLDGHANMFNVFSTYDFLLSIGMKPIVELSFMPQLLASNPNLTVFHYQGGISPPADWNAWRVFIQEFTQALVSRYTLQEVSTWKFEVWNEPNCGFYYEGNCCGDGCGNQAAYFQLYNVTAAAIKSVAPSLKVGGPATAQTQWIPEFLSWTKSHGVPVDFVSSHLYPTDPQVPTDRDGFFAVINASAAVVAQAGLPLTMTEFNTGLGILHGQDDPYSAAFVVHQHLVFQTVQNLDTLSFWTFSDIFEEQGFISAPYHDGFGMQTVYKVPKPVYRAFQMIAQQPATAVPVTVSGGVARPGSATSGTVDVSVSFGRDASITTAFALLTNFNTPGQTIATETVTITFNNIVGRPPASASLTLIDSSHGYARPVWVAAGSPAYPSNAEVAQELAASSVSAVSIPLTSVGGGSYSVTVTLEAQAVASISFQF